MRAPSKLAERVITLVVRDPEWRDGVLGDLREEHARLAARVGAARARRWHLRQSVGIAVRYGVHRLARRGPPPRWLAVAAQEPGGSWRAGLARDLLHAWRSVIQRPALSCAIVVTLALALAANSTTFSLLDALVLRPYRFDGVDDLIVAATRSPTQTLLDPQSVSRADFREWQSEATLVQQWAAYEWWDANLSGVDIPEQVPGFRVSPGFFATLGVQPILGRGFHEDEAEPGRHRRVVLGHDLWVRRFGSRPDIVGATVRLDGEPYQVVGVAPDGFEVPLGAEVWSPLSYTVEAWADRRADNLAAIGRLAQGATLDDARSELTTIIDRQRRDYPDTNANRLADVMSFTHGMSDPGAAAFMVIGQSASALLLLIACANIANLLLARGSERAQEYAVRLALGASPFRLFAQTILEGLILSMIAVAASLPLAAAGLQLTRAAVPAPLLRFIPGFEFLQVDVRLMLMTAAMAIVATLVFALVPAFQATRARVADSMRQGSRNVVPGRRWTRSVLASMQVALALALLFGSGLVLTAASSAVSGVMGFDKQSVLVAQLVLPERTYADAGTRRQFITRVLDGVRQIPAVAAAGVTNSVPAGFSNTRRRFWPEGQDLRENETRFANFRLTSEGYFTALQIPLIGGRWADDRDREGAAPVAAVSASLAQDYWPGADPLGRRFKLSAQGEWITVIGVVGDVVHNWFTHRRDHTVYRPLAQDAPYTVAFTLRTVGDPLALAGDLRRAVAAADPAQPIASLAPLDVLVEERAGGVAFIANVLGVVALIALGLSIMGVYSLMTFITGQRTQEIGVRIALGAGRWQVIRLATAHALHITIAGTVAGAALALGVGRILQSALFGLVAASWWQLAALVMALALSAMLAAYLPARRAATIDPMNALRES
jgi:putative ABC transport system permease protein